MLVKQYAQYELADGTVSEPIRIIFADKVALDHAARANGWDISTDFTRVNSLLAWSAAHRSGATTLTYDEFVEALTDVIVERGDPVDPTPKDQPSD